MSSSERITSITTTKATSFLRDAKKRDKEAKKRETLACDMISGFHLMNTKRGGSWRLRYTGTNGKGETTRKVVTIGKYPMKPEEAAQIALEWRVNNIDPLAEADKKKLQAKADYRKSQERSLEAYLDGLYSDYQHNKKSGKSTISLIKSNFKHLLDRDMASLTKLDVRAWQSDKVKAGRLHGTLQRSYGALKTMLNHAVREDEILDTNPLKDVHLMPPSATEKSQSVSSDAKSHRRLLTSIELSGIHSGLELFAEELRAQRRNSRAHGKSYLPDLDAVTYPHWFIPYCHLALNTGLRPGDLYALKWEDIDLRFKKQLRKVPEKTMHHREPAVVVMPLNEGVVQILKEWQKQGKKTGPVFPSPVTGVMMDKQAHSKPWKHVLRLGQIDQSLHFYSIRHHFISRLVTDGVPLLQIARLVGHRSASMIENHYGHLCPDAAVDIMVAYAHSLSETAKPEKTKTI